MRRMSGAFHKVPAASGVSAAFASPRKLAKAVSNAFRFRRHETGSIRPKTISGITFQIYV
jgi:hypothetical protein